MSEDTEGKWIVHFQYLHKKSGVVQVDKKSTQLDQAKSSSREISILGFFFSFIVDLVFTNENRLMFNIHKHHGKVRW